MRRSGLERNIIESSRTIEAENLAACKVHQRTMSCFHLWRIRGSDGGKSSSLSLSSCFSLVSSSLLYRFLFLQMVYPVIVKYIIRGVASPRGSCALIVNIILIDLAYIQMFKLVKQICSIDSWSPESNSNARQKLTDYQTCFELWAMPMVNVGNCDSYN